MQVTIEAISRKDKEIQGVMKQVTAIKTTEYADKWLSTFSVTECADWQKGDVVDIEVTQKGEFLNFRPVPLRVKVAKMEQDLQNVMQFLKNKYGADTQPVVGVAPVTVPASSTPTPKKAAPINKFDNTPLPEGVTLDDIPF